MDWVEWLQQNWMLIYIVGVLAVGLLSALVLFFGTWWFAAARYELGGLVLGWVPGAVAAGVGGLVLGFAWPLSVPLICWVTSAFLEARG